MGTPWSPSFPRQSLARRRARNIVQVHAHALNGSWECYHVVRIGLGAIWGDHGRRRSLHFTTPHLCLKKGWVYPLLSITPKIMLVQMYNIFRLLLGDPDYSSSSESYREKQKSIGFIVIISQRGVCKS